MSPLDRKNSLKDQAYVARESVAEKAQGGRADNRHNAYRKRLLQVSREYPRKPVFLDPDTV